MKFSSSLLPRILTNIFKSMFGFGVGLLIAALLVLVAMRAPAIHQSWIRSYVGSYVFYVFPTSDGSGGTAFSVVAPSGRAYFLTNDHICVESTDGFVTLSTDDGGAGRVKILERSQLTDLCLLDSVIGQPGLTLGISPTAGTLVQAVGHPDLKHLSVSPIGEIFDVGPTVLSDTAASSTSKTLMASINCDEKNPKFKKVKDGNMSWCEVTLPSVYYTNVLVKPGNSGSPVVDFYGDVVGVVTGVDEYGWGLMVPLEEIQFFLAKR